MAPRSKTQDKSTESPSTSRSGRDASAGKDAIQLLTADHDAVKALFKKYEKLCSQDADQEDKESLARQICGELTIHAQIEEEIFYPALRAALDDVDLLNEADVEHASAKELIAQIEDSDGSDEHYDAKVTVLGEYINHHVGEEQGEMFKQARASKIDLDSLGEELAARKQELKGETEDDDADDEDSEGDRSSNRERDRDRAGSGRVSARQRD